ncbi:MAG: LLM class flavin-dependent oxidoreductase [Actinomycetota bacterium]
MEIGISVSSSIVADHPQRALSMMVERAAAAHAAGFSSLSVGDHHAQGKWYAQNTPTLGRLLATWPDRRAGCLFLVPLWSPVLMAEQIGTLAAMVDAPFVVQVGIGSGAGQFASMGADLSTRGRVTDEAIDLVQTLLAGDEAESSTLGVGPTRLGLVPAQPIEWWIGGHAPATMERAARLGAAWYAGPGPDHATAAALLDDYRAACARHGAEPRAVIRRDVLLRHDGAEARRRAEAIVAAGYRGMAPDVLVVGGAAEAVAELRALADLGFDEVVVRSMSLDQTDALESIAVLGDLVGSL